MLVAEPASQPAAPSSNAVVAPGGNALLRRGAPLEAANRAQAATLVLGQHVDCRMCRFEHPSATVVLWAADATKLLARRNPGSQLRPSR